MPRRTTKQFQADHDWLRELWLKDKGWYARLGSTEQWQLHAYFEPELDLLLEHLAAHRVSITTEHAALPQQAGRVLADLRRAVAQDAKVGRTVIRHPGKRQPRGSVTVKAVVRPHPDVDRLVRVIVDEAVRDIATELKQDDH